MYIFEVRESETPRFKIGIVLYISVFLFIKDLNYPEISFHKFTAMKENTLKIIRIIIQMIIVVVILLIIKHTIDYKDELIKHKQQQNADDN